MIGGSPVASHRIRRPLRCKGSTDSRQLGGYMTPNALREAPAPRFPSHDHSDLVETVPSGGRAPGVLRCGLFILGLKIALKLIGFRRTLDWLERRVRRVPLKAMATPAQIIGAQHAVATAAALYPGRALCLEQSVALFYFLRRSGIGARLRLGVKPYPFEAHAWVEYDGAPVNDFAEHVRHFVPLPDLRK